ncbi:unnamed protein product [Miscanthus lutarioriparius]|uniref:Potassium channel domain-containing protein n=1 Tax=Miscanthus lutarioriparius TaxID=422564 RepID=A0A811QCU1_9POAL|nr:unnamed protein product [Miscanthus lutarioriparius]
MAENGVQQHLLHDGDRSKMPPPGVARRFRRCQTAPSHNAEQGSILLRQNMSRKGASGAFCRRCRQWADHRGNLALDALYFCVVTMTTVGSKALVFRAVHLNHADDPKSLRDMEASKVPYKLYTATGFLAVVLASGMAFLMKVKGMRLVDAFYCVCATVTTLGYGDRSFSSTAGRAFAAAWITVSTLVVALFFLYAAELAAERRQRELAHWVLTRRTTSMDLEAADLDGDHRVSAAEFALYKLKELGKISQEEIAESLEEFDKLDVDHSGTLSSHDLAVAQPG